MKVADIRAWLEHARSAGTSSPRDAGIAEGSSAADRHDAFDRDDSFAIPVAPARSTAPRRSSRAWRAWHGRRICRARWPRVAALVLVACALLPLVRPLPAEGAAVSTGFEWPTHRDGAALRPLALSEVEHRFAQRFPGRIARFTDDRSRVFVLRHVTQPTRMLHPAADCFRATGYAIEQARLERDERQRMWRCFVARRAGTGGLDGEALRVCERIEAVGARALTAGGGDTLTAVGHDTFTAAGGNAFTAAVADTSAASGGDSGGDDLSAADGGQTVAAQREDAFTDASAWFWAATLGDSRGPWLATTIVEAL
jgi:hypothetical protein